LPIPGRDLKGIHFAMEFLGQMQRALFNQNPALMDNCMNFRTPFKGNKDWKVTSDGSYIDVKDKNVVVIGGGDTGTDCTATSLRQGCKSLVNLELMDKPPEERDDVANAWPAYPRIFRTDYGQEEVKKRDGKDPRKYAVMTKRFIEDGNGGIKAIEIVNLKVARDANNRPTIEEIKGSEQTIPCDVVIRKILPRGMLSSTNNTPSLYCLSFSPSIPLDPRSNAPYNTLLATDSSLADPALVLSQLPWVSTVPRHSWFLPLVLNPHPRPTSRPSTAPTAMALPHRHRESSQPAIAGAGSHSSCGLSTRGRGRLMLSTSTSLSRGHSRLCALSRMACRAGGWAAGAASTPRLSSPRTASPKKGSILCSHSL